MVFAVARGDVTAFAAGFDTACGAGKAIAEADAIAAAIFFEFIRR